MALEMILRNSNPFQYLDCNTTFTGADVYGGYCTNGSMYRESISIFESFVYNRVKDRYFATFTMSQKKYPSWSLMTLEIHPETGAVLKRTNLSSSPITHAWTQGVYNGGLDKTYAIYIAYPTRIVEITSTDQVPTTAQINNPIVTQLTLSDLSLTVYGHAVCPERKMVVLLSGGPNGIVTYNYSTNPATKLYNHPFTELYAWSMGYEDDQRVWMLFANDIWTPSNAVATSLVKYNFWYNRIELLTDLQPATQPDRFAKVAWDTRRKKLCAFRIKADGGGGAAVNAIEFYTPRPAMTRISVPVPLSRLATDRKTVLSTTLSGSKGEAGGGQRQIDLTAVPSRILTTQNAFTQDSGSANFTVAPDGPYTEYQVSVAYDEDKETN